MARGSFCEVEATTQVYVFMPIHASRFLIGFE
jgi:hypothetical protein